MVVLGIDVGASKTHAVLADEQGHVLGTGRAGCGNWESVGLDGAQAAFGTAVDHALADAGLAGSDIAASGYGLAGLDWPSDEDRLKPVIEALGVGGPYVMVNDAFLPLRAGTRDGVGLAAIAGSGTTVAGRNRAGQIARSFGAGYPFPDWGGATDIVVAAVHAVALAYRRMGPETTLGERLLAATGCTTVIEMLEKVMRWQVKISGRWAPHVFQAADEGDVAARSIVRRAGETIGANAVSVAGELDMLDSAYDLVTAGGVFSSRSALLNETLLETVRAQSPQVNLVHWESPPVVGALLLALDLMDLPNLPDTSKLASQVRASLAM
jgi:N-acetylglucosamine kinase-like BadF-type ATPase